MIVENKMILAALGAAVLFIVPVNSANAAESSEKPVEKRGYFSQIKYDFSREGVKEWQPEVTASYGLLLAANVTDVTIGVRIDPNRAWGIGIGMRDIYYDAYPGTTYSVAVYLWNRHYFYLGPKHRTSFYTDWGLGASWIYKETIGEPEFKKGTVGLDLRLAPGFSVSLYKNLRLFIGPYVAASGSFGLHTGVAF